MIPKKIKFLKKNIDITHSIVYIIKHIVYASTHLRQSGPELIAK